ncbi:MULTISPECIES: hypothetical protein [unclassified Bradyrhizobium]
MLEIENADEMVRVVRQRRERGFEGLKLFIRGLATPDWPRLTQAMLLSAGAGLAGCDWPEETGFVEVKQSFATLAVGDTLILNSAPLDLGARSSLVIQHPTGTASIQVKPGETSRKLCEFGSEKPRGDRDAGGGERVPPVLGAVVRLCETFRPSPGSGHRPGPRFVRMAFSALAAQTGRPVFGHARSGR